METARKWGVRPLEFFGIERQGAWTIRDRQLAVALEVYERNTCPDCGHPTRIAFDPDMDGWFEVPDDPVICYACAARERKTADEHFKPEPGQKLPVVNTRK